MAGPNDLSSNTGRRVMLAAVTWSFCFIALWPMAFRIYRRSWNLPLGKAAFWGAIVGYGFAILAQSFLSVAVANGLGDHYEEAISHSHVSQLMKYTWIAVAMATLSIGSGIFSAAMFELDLSKGTNDGWRNVLKGVALINVLVNIVTAFTVMFQCNPYEALWNPEIPADCRMIRVNQNFSYFTGALNAASNVLLAVYPVKIYWSLQMKQGEKILLSIVSLTVLLSAACALVKTYNLKQLSVSNDQTYLLPILLIWAWVEMWINLIVTSALPLGRMWENLQQKIKKKLRGPNLTTNGILNRRSRVTQTRQEKEDSEERTHITVASSEGHDDDDCEFQEFGSQPATGHDEWGHGGGSCSKLGRETDGFALP